jgi:hypothetical protein
MRHEPTLGSQAMRILALVLACLVAAPAAAKDVTVTATPVPLNPGDAKQTTVDSLEYVAGFALDSAAPEWGGYSGMVLAGDGLSLLAVSDVGHWLKLELKHDDSGALTGVDAARLEPLLDEAGRPIEGKEWSDAEEISEVDGQIFVSFERRHRIWRYASAAGIPDGPAHMVSVADAVKSLPENSGLEAMTVAKNGQLVLIAEGGANARRGSRVWFGKDSAWTETAVERSDGFEPTSLAQSADGDLFLLERRYTETDGPAARVSLLGAAPGDRGLAGFTLGVLRRPLTVDNFEAIAVRPAADGGVYVYLLSDDNQSDQQRTLLLQFRTRLD